MEDPVQPATLLVTLDNIGLSMEGRELLSGISFAIRYGEHWAITGPSGSGKTMLAKVLAGRIFHQGKVDWPGGDDKKGIVLVEQQHHFTRLNNTAQFYYQQRFNAAEAGDSHTVEELLSAAPEAARWMAELGLSELLQKPVLQLSNGENKRLQLARALGMEPAVLVLDNPFTGLDVTGRASLGAVLDRIAGRGIHLILITAGITDLPGCITHLAKLEEGCLTGVTEYNRAVVPSGLDRTVVPPYWEELLAGLPVPPRDFGVAVKMEGVSIRYGDQKVLDNISWEVKKGSCWSLSGPNGAGKSTLLSLITADNPQAYANNIVLFDRVRGTGESIWDIKQKIGFVSPEMHLYFEKQSTGFEVVASGLFDTIGLFRRLNAAQSAVVDTWLRVFGLVSLSGKRLSQLSLSQQRMLLLARALVRNPPLLVLDEPAQGLDAAQHALLKALVNEMCRRFGTTLIYVSHYAADLPECISQFLRLEQGRAVG